MITGAPRYAQNRVLRKDLENPNALGILQSVPESDRMTVQIPSAELPDAGQTRGNSRKTLTGHTEERITWTSLHTGRFSASASAKSDAHPKVGQRMVREKTKGIPS